jgi:hypothetical protein
MNPRRICIVLLLAALVLPLRMTFSCTTAIVSGKATKDGRPLIWKQRDTGKYENKLVYHRGERFAYLGVHDLADTAGEEVFMGANEVGFCVINTASYNLVYDRYPGKMDEEGFLMKKALATCRTVEDFEALLRQTRGKRGVEANFGVIDAAGGAAYFETDPYAFKKFDVNDPAVAPQGYLLRTNFSVSGTPDQGQGYNRYQTMSDLFMWAYLGEGLSVDFILSEALTCLRHSMTGIDLGKPPFPPDAGRKAMVPFVDFVPRYSTTASLVVQGVKKNEDPLLTSLWLVLGNPLVTPVLPVFVSYGAQNPSFLFAAPGKPAELNDLSLRLKAQCFPVRTPEGKGYVDLARLLNQEGTGTLQMLRTTNSTLVQKGQALVAEARRNGLKSGNLQTYYKWAEGVIREFYRGYGLE